MKLLWRSCARAKACKSDSGSECFLNKKKISKKMCCTRATGVSDMAAHLFGELDEKEQSL